MPRPPPAAGTRTPLPLVTPPSPPPVRSRRGATAAILTTQSLTEGINSRADLVGKAIGTWDMYVDKLRAEGLPTFGFKWWVGTREGPLKCDWALGTSEGVGERGQRRNVARLPAFAHAAAWHSAESGSLVPPRCPAHAPPLPRPRPSARLRSQGDTGRRGEDALCAAQQPSGRPGR